MEGKSTDKDGAASPRGYSYGDEDVFDFPGVEDEADANGPVSRDAHLALKEGNGGYGTRFVVSNVHGIKWGEIFTP